MQNEHSEVETDREENRSTLAYEQKQWGLLKTEKERQYIFYLNVSHI